MKTVIKNKHSIITQEGLSSEMNKYLYKVVSLKRDINEKRKWAIPVFEGTLFQTKGKVIPCTLHQNLSIQGVLQERKKNQNRGIKVPSIIEEIFAFNSFWVRKS